jgi:flagellar FliL protein
MAVKDQERDDDETGDEKPKKPKKQSGPMGLIIVGAIALFVAVLGAQVAAPLVTQMIAGSKKAATEQPGDEEQQLASAEPTEQAAPDQPDIPKEPALYTPLDPPFVVSFNDANGDTRFVQLTLQAMARNQKTIDAIKLHAPAIRNSFLFLISGYKIEDLETLKGKEKLRADMLKAANDILEKNTGSGDMEDLYFTSLVIQ